MTSIDSWPPAYESVKSPKGDVQEVYDHNDNQHNLRIGSPTSFYTDAYTHGYTEGYIAGYEHPEVPKPPQQIPIAIVGMSCRLPGSVTTPDEFWELCSRARNIWSEVPKERFDSAAFYHPNPGKSGTFNAKGGYFLKEDVGLFDAPFFSLTAQEATSMDPQQRILLECTFEALESAGFPKQEILGKDVGVFIGGSFSEYESQLFADTETNPMYQSTGNAFAMQAARLSHFFDLRGPSFTMDTACSSTLVALHQACQSLRNGECKSAIVGGCHLNLLPEFWISMSQSRLFSDAGRSFSFDSRGTGYGRGEGCGMVILKPLDQAIRDNDNIRSVIVGSGINQDGRTPGITMPNGAAQESLMKQVYATAGLDPKETGYVEAHGTGTKVGDPIEATALHNVFGEERTARNPLFVGSIKSNIGHLEAASGIMAVIKTALMLERGFILPNFDFKKPNEKIPFTKWNLKVPISQRPWPRGKRFASVNNFGFGGTNAHIIMEKAPLSISDEPRDTDNSGHGRKLFVLSANDKPALENIMKNIGIYLEQRPEIFQNDLIDNVAYTLGERRSLLQWRVAIPATTSFELVERLNSGKVSPVREIEPLRIGYVFTGQGAQWAQMGRTLYEHFPVFAATMDACDEYLLTQGATFSLREELAKDSATSLINEAQISQPSCTAIQIGLTDLLRSWNIIPSAVTGHSSGEIAAAYAAGILPLQACMAASYYRGLATIELRNNFPSLAGSMMAVGCTKEEMEPLLANLANRNIRIACYNSPTSLTISGDAIAIDELQAIIQAKEMFNRKLQVDVAYHSSHMELVADNYRKALSTLPEPVATDIRFYSSLHGRQVSHTELQPSYWVDNLTQAVRFSEALSNMCQPVEQFKTGTNLLIELGPHSALAGPVKQILKACGANAIKIPYTSVLVRNRDAVETALELASTLFVRGASMKMSAVNIMKKGKSPTLLVDMPRYPWNHATKYWHEPRIMQKHKNRSAPRNDLLGVLANYSNDFEPTWRNIIRVDDLPWLRHHRIQGLTLFPMSGFLAMAIEAASQKAISNNLVVENYDLRDVSVIAPLMITEQDIELTLQLRPHQEALLTSSDTWDEFRINSWTNCGGWTEHCKGLISVRSIKPTRSVPILSNVEISHVDTVQMYETLNELGVAYGTTFQGMRDCQANDKYSNASIIVMETAQEMPHQCESNMIIHPTFLEQLVSAYWPVILRPGKVSLETIYLPSSIGRLSISQKMRDFAIPGSTLKATCQRKTAPSSQLKPIQLAMWAAPAADTSEILIMIEDLVVNPIIDSTQNDEQDKPRELCYKVDWELAFDLANDDEKTHFPTQSVVIIHGESDAQRQLASEIGGTLEQISGTPPTKGLLSEVDAKDKLCLVISELEKPLLSTLTTEGFACLQQVITNAQGILWVVESAYVDSKNPDLNMVTGLSRSIRSESLLKFATLDLDVLRNNHPMETTKTILRILTLVFGTNVAANCELEFSIRDGQVYTPRIVNDEEMNEHVHAQQNTSQLQVIDFRQENRPLKLAFENTNVLSALHFEDQQYTNELGPNEVLIEVKAIGLNYRDLDIIAGEDVTFQLGSEVSGIIISMGSAVTSFEVGTRVAGVSPSGGLIATHARLQAVNTFEIKNDVSFETAASLVLAYCTAQYVIHDLVRLQQEDLVLVHGANSAVGQAMVSMLRDTGAQVSALVQSSEAKEELVRQETFSEDNIIVRGMEIFDQATQRQRFAVIINCTSTNKDTSRDLLELLDDFGRFVDCAPRASNQRRSTDLCAGNKGFLSVDIDALIAQRPHMLRRLMAGASIDLQNPVQLCNSKVFSAQDLESAFRSLKASEGKVVISPQPGDQVRAVPSALASQILRSDATYILIGGTGGLGRSMAKWMVSRGARILVLVSRSGLSTGKVHDLIEEVSALGVNVVVRKCNVANRIEVEKLIVEGLVGLPEVRGVIHGAMVLSDVLFEKMTYDQYTMVVESKVSGAWNFHNALSSHNLDFFVAISSAAGAVGNRGQAAYSAANTFLNAFVQHRISLGLPAASLDLTAVSDAGYLAEDAEKAAEVSRNLGSDTICEKEVLSLLEAAINGKLAKSCNGHTITGMRITPENKPFWTTDAKFKHLRMAAEAVDSSSDEQSGVISYHAALKASQSPEEAQDVVCNGLLAKLPSVLMLEAEDMDVTRSLANYALDSLVAIEVRNYITREFEANLQVLELLSSGSIEMLAKTIVNKSKLVTF